MSFPVRATTTATNKRRSRQQPEAILKKPESEYLQVLNVIEKSRRSKSPMDQQRKDVARFSSRLSSIGQEAMLQTYEDTLLTHLNHLYSSDRISAVFPRDRKSTSIDHPNRLQSIRQAQNLVDQFDRNSSDRDRLLSNYVRWQKNKK